MRAVNLIPPEDKRSAAGVLKLAPATYGVLGTLLAALVLMTAHVLIGNTVASRQAQVASLHAELTQAQAQAAQLGRYTTFASTAQARLSAVHGIAATRFDWQSALANLARAVPADASLQSLSGTVVPGAGSGGGGGSGLRADLTGPAFELNGCTRSQDDVARVISRLRAMPDVTRVSLSSSTLAGGSGSGVAAAPSGASGGCSAGDPMFSLVVFFTPVAGAGPNGATTAGSSTTTSTGGAK